MRRTFFYARRTVAVLLILLVIWFVASFVYAVTQEPLGGSILVLPLALLGGLVFLLWIVFRVFGGLIRLIAGRPPRREQRRGLGAEYEEMVVRAQAQRGWLRRR